MLGELISGLFGLGTSALSSYMSYDSARKLQSHQADLNTEALRNYYTNNRYSLTKAGYNPLLAVPGSTAQGFSANSGGVPVDLGEGAMKGVNSALAMQNIKSQVDLNSANSNLVKEQAKTEQAKRTNYDFQNAMLDVQKHLADKDLSSYDRRFYSNLYEQFQRAENYKANSAVARMNAETERQNMYVNRMNAETQRKVGSSQSWRNYNASLGYTSSGSGLGFSYSHTGNPNIITRNSGHKAHYQYETINGKRVKVRVFK